MLLKPKQFDSVLFLLALVFFFFSFAPPLHADTSPGSGDIFATAHYLLIDEELMTVSPSSKGSTARCFLPSSHDFSNGEWKPNGLSSAWNTGTGIQTNFSGEDFVPVILRDDANKAFLAQVWHPTGKAGSISVSLVPVNQSGFGAPYNTMSAGNGTCAAVSTADFIGQGGQQLVVGYLDGMGHLNFSISLPSEKPDPVVFTDNGVSANSAYGLRIATGDVNGDGQPEIAAIYSSTQGDAIVRLYSVDHNRVVTCLGAHSFSLSYKSFDIAFADWDGNGKAMLFCGFGHSDSITLRLVKVDLSGASPAFSEVLNETPVIFGRAGDVRVQAGDLDGDAKDELVVASTSFFTQQNDNVTVYYRIPYNRTPTGYSSTTQSLQAFPTFTGKLDMRVCNFTGRLNPSALSGNHAQIALFDGAFFYILSLKRSGNSDASISSVAFASFTETDPHIVTGDLDGDNMILGDPTHIVLENNISPLLFLNEPPKHTDVDNSGKTTNYTRFDDFYLQYSQTDSSSSETTNTQTMENSLGVSLSQSRSAGVDLGAASLTAEEKTTVTASISGKKEHIENNFSSQSTSLSGQTNRDDFVLFRCHTVHIWRYPVLGWFRQPDDGGDKGQAFYQVVIPDAGAQDEAIHLIAGQNVDWYHPVHMNGNVLSYPSDAGQIPDYSEANLLSGLVEIDVGGGNVFNRTIDWSSSNSSENMKDLSVSIGVDVEAQFNGSVKADAISAGGSVAIDASVDDRISKSSSSKTTVTKENAFEVNLPSISSALSYTTTPLMYKTAGNVLKASHVVGGIAGEQSWISLYGKAPDPALNLPKIWKFHDVVHTTDDETWTWTDDSEVNPEAREIRGIFFRDADGHDLGTSLTLGNTVTIAVRVHNFSLRSCNSVDVLFEAATYDPNTGIAGSRFAIGTVTTPVIPQWGATAQNWVWASKTWDTTGLEEGNYRIFVTVNPDKLVSELSGKGLDETYDNNRGWFDVFLFTKDTSVKYPETVSLCAESLTASTPAFSNTYLTGEIVSLSGTIHNNSSRAIRGLAVFFYDGDPVEGGKAFAVKTIPGIRAGGKHPLTVTNIFSTPGKHVIHMHVLSKQGEEDFSDNVATLPLIVDGLGDKGSGGGCILSGRGASFLLLLILPLVSLLRK